MNRREALKTGLFGCIGFINNPFANPKLITITYRLDDQYHQKTFNLNVSTEKEIMDLHDTITEQLWFGGNYEGVFDKIQYQGNKYLLKGNNKCISPSIYSKKYYCELEIPINNQYTLRINRFYIAFDDKIKKYTKIGSSVGLPTGINGRNHEILFGKIIR